MLVIPYVLQPGRFGLGLYAAIPLLKNTIVYREQPGFLMVVPETTLNTWTQEARDRFLTHAYRGQGRWRLTDAYYFNADDSRFMNHEDHPSLISMEEGAIYVTARDLDIGEELTCDYREFAQRGDSCFDF